MNMKTCSGCQLEKDVQCFYKKGRKIDSYTSQCKDCIKEKRKIHYGNNREKIITRVGEYNKRINRNETRRDRYKDDSEYRQGILLEVSEYNNRVNTKERRRNRYRDDHEYRKRILLLASSRYRENSLHKRMSSMVRYHLVENKNRVSWLAGVDYSIKELRIHIENQFRDGMSWEHFYAGMIHIDHIIPAIKFNFISIYDQSFRDCWALSNLQPLWAYDNLSKGSKEG
jgi:hypothetical protein